MSIIRFYGLGIALLLGTWCFAADGDADTKAEKEEKPAMELGGYVTVDYSAPVDDLSAPDFGIGEVDLGANVNISEEVVASVVIMAENQLDYLWIDQALVSYKPAAVPMELLFGQQTFSHGLLSTRLISDPLILEMEDMELSAPGVVVNGTFDYFSGGLGFTILNKAAGINVMGDSVTEQRYAGILNADVPLPNESMVRLSSLVYKEYADIDVAGTMNVRNLVCDAEVVMVVNSPATVKQSGVFGGVLWNINDRFGVALRGDAFSNNQFETMKQRFAFGGTVAIKDGIFAAIELAHEVPESGSEEAYQTIALQIGLEQKLSLPGFQRKTLTRE